MLRRSSREVSRQFPVKTTKTPHCMTLRKIGLPLYTYRAGKQMQIFPVRCIPLTKSSRYRLIPETGAQITTSFDGIAV